MITKADRQSFKKIIYKLGYPLVQSSFHTTWVSLFEKELELNSLDWNGNELEQELDDMKRAMK